MKRTLPIFSLAIAAALAIRVQAQAPPELAGQGGGGAVQPAGSENHDAEALVERVQRNLDALPSLSAEVRNPGRVCSTIRSPAPAVHAAGQWDCGSCRAFELKSSGRRDLYADRDQRRPLFWTFRELPGGPS